MEDSGIDSEDRQSNIYEDGAAGLLVSGHPTVEYRNKGSWPSPMQKSASGAPKHMSDLEFEVAFRGASKVYAPTTIEIDEDRAARGTEGRSEPPNTCRILQRKLELKVERARRNYTQYQEQAEQVCGEEHVYSQVEG